MPPVSSNDPLTNCVCRLRPAIPGILFAVLTLLFSFGLGIVFGLDEEAIKSRLKASATEVRESVYHNDEAAMRAVLDKSWVYMQRAHLHAGGLGNTALGLTLLLILMGCSPTVVRAGSLASGAGGLGYSVYWLWAGCRAPALGSTSAAKESLKWLAMPSSGAIVIATIAVSVLLVAALARRPFSQPSNLQSPR